MSGPSPSSRRERRSTASLWIAACAAIVCSSSSCGGGGDGGGGAGGGSTCVSAPSCPEGGPPSYKTEIAPIFQETCVFCHSPKGTAGFFMTTYAEVHSEFGAILSQVTVCQMPPLDGPTLTDAQRVALTAWLRCGAPDN